MRMEEPMTIPTMTPTLEVKQSSSEHIPSQQYSQDLHSEPSKQERPRQSVPYTHL